MTDSYRALAEVYEWLVPDELLTPDGAATAFAGVLDTLPPGARVLDCAAGTGTLAVGLALRGFDVTASDASEPMTERTRDLAGRHGVVVPSVTCDWESLGAQGWDDSFDAVLCVGNSLTHAAGPVRRRAALSAMARVLREDGLLVVTSRNWELVRACGSGLRVADRLVEREGVLGLVIYAWTLGERWGDPHCLDVAVALLDGAAVTTHSERLPFWPFRHDELGDDLRAAGLEVETDGWASEVDRYLVTARRAGPADHR